MSFVDTLRAAFAPADFIARPQYGIGYVPVADQLGDVGDVDPKRSMDEARDAAANASASWSEAKTAWTLFGAAVVVAAGVDLFFLTRRQRREKGRSRGRV